MNKDGIIRGQYISPEKLARSKELRKKMTQAEAVLWRRLRANRLDGFHFRRQQIIDGFIVDFYCHRVGLIIEVDGPIHGRTRDYDAWRQEILESRGLTVLRFTNDDVLNHCPDVLARIRAHLRGHTPRPESDL